VKIWAVRVAAGLGPLPRLTGGCAVLRASGGGTVVRAARDAGTSWYANPFLSLALGSLT
jgi:hypothetical protein